MTDVGNYRPISILSCISKIIEKLKHMRLSSFLSRHNILYQCQYGFREGYSTNRALVEIMDQVHKALNDGNMYLGYIWIYQKLLIPWTILCC